MGGLGSIGTGHNQHTKLSDLREINAKIPEEMLKSIKRRPNSVKRSDRGTKRNKVRKTLAVVDDYYPSLLPSFFEHQKDLANTLKDIAKFEKQLAEKPMRIEAAKKRHRDRVRAKGYNRKPDHNLKRYVERLNKLPIDMICLLCNSKKQTTRQFVRYNDRGDMCCRSCFTKALMLVKKG